MLIPKPTYYASKSRKKCRILPLPQCSENWKWVLAHDSHCVNQKAKPRKSGKSTVFATLRKHAWLSCSVGGNLRRSTPLIFDCGDSRYEKSVAPRLCGGKSGKISL